MGKRAEGFVASVWRTFIILLNLFGHMIIWLDGI
jgi:hypothetical protein